MAKATRGPEAQRALLRASRAVLVAKYAGVVTREFGVKGHAHGHETRVEHAVPRVALASEWPFR